MKNVSKIVALMTLFSLVIFGLSFFPVNDFKIYASDDDFTPSPSPLIVEQFTGAWCGWCPIASACLDWEKLVEFKNDEFVRLAFHNKDQMSIAEGGEREDLYGVKKVGWPTVIIGGIKKISGVYNPPRADMYSIDIKEGIANLKSIVDISIKGSSEPKQFELKMKAKEDFGKRNISLVAVIYEDWVNFLGPNGEAFHRNVVKNMPYGSSGRTGIKLKAGQIYEETRKFALQTKNWNNIGIVVFLQDMDTKQMLGSGLFKYSNVAPAIFYWGDQFQLLGEVNAKTCNNKVKFSVQNASGLAEIFLKVKLDVLNFDLIDAVVSPEIGTDKAIIDFNPSIGEIRINFKEPVSGNRELFVLTIKFKQKAEAVIFQIVQFVALDKSASATPFELVDLRNFSYFKVEDNPYDIDSTLSVDEGDVSALLKKFGSFKRDKDFNKKCDFNKDGRVDLKDLTELLINLES